jgi:hypothetical protein
MDMMTRKSIWWYGLAAAVGGTLMFVYLLILEGMRGPPARIYFWPAGTVTLMLVSIFRLRSCYRAEPGPSEGFWQLSISDLIVAALLLGAMLTGFQAAWPRYFLQAGIPAAFLTGAHFVAGMLVAARRGIQSKSTKYLFGVGFLLRNYGALGVGTGIILFIVILLLGDSHQAFDYLACAVFLHDRPHEGWAYYPVRAGILMLPVGLVLCRLVNSAPKN